MPNFTQVIVMGNLTRDPELRYLPAGTAVCDFTVAVNSSYTKEGGEKVERVDFYDVTMWKRLAEVAAEYLKKGRPVFVSGQLQQDRWEDETTGQKRSKVRIIGRQMQFLGSGSQDDTSAAPAQEAAPAAQEKSNGSKGQKGRTDRKPQAGPPVDDNQPF